MGFENPDLNVWWTQHFSEKDVHLYGSPTKLVQRKHTRTSILAP